MALRRMNSELDLQSKGNGAGKAYRAEKRYLQLGMRDTNRDSVASLASSAGDDLTPRVKGDSVTRGGVRKREDEEIIWEGGWEGEHSDAGSVRMGSKPSTPTPRGGDVAAEAEDTDEEAIYRALSASTDSERSNTSAHKRCIGFGFTNLELEGDAAETVGLGLGLGREDSDTLPPSDDNSLGVGKERKSMESKRPKLAEAKRNSSVWDDGEKFWNHFLPGQGQGQGPVSLSRTQSTTNAAAATSPTASGKSSTLATTKTNRTEDNVHSSTSVRVSKQRSPQRRNQMRKSAILNVSLNGGNKSSLPTSAVDRGKDRSKAGGGGGRTGWSTPKIEVVPPSSGEGTPGSLYDQQGFLR